MLINFDTLTYRTIQYQKEDFTLQPVTATNLIDVSIIRDDQTQSTTLNLGFSAIDSNNKANPNETEKVFLSFMTGLLASALHERLSPFLTDLCQIVGDHTKIPTHTSEVTVIWNDTQLAWHSIAETMFDGSLGRVALASIAYVAYATMVDRNPVFTKALLEMVGYHSMMVTQSVIHQTQKTALERRASFTVIDASFKGNQ
jgi:hypothetical protein